MEVTEQIATSICSATATQSVLDASLAICLHSGESRHLQQLDELALCELVGEAADEQLVGPIGYRCGHLAQLLQAKRHARGLQ